MTAGTPPLPPADHLRRLWQALTAPAAALTGQEERRQARLLAAVLLGALLALVISLGLRHSISFLSAGALATLAILYALSRTRLYRIAAVLMLLGFFAYPWAMLLIHTDYDPLAVSFALMWLVLPVVVASLLFRLRMLLGVIGASAVGMLLLTALIPGIGLHEISLALWFLTIVSLLVAALAALHAADNARLAAQARHLAASEERYRRLVESFPLATAVTVRGLVAYANPEALALLGAEHPDQAAGRPLASFLQSEGAAPPGNSGQTGSLLEPVAPPPGRVIRLDGTVVDVETTTITIDYQGEPASLIVLRDISERRRAEEALRRLKDFNESIIHNMTEGIVIQNAEGFFTFLNPAAAAMLGYTVEELLGRHGSLVVPPDQPPVFTAADPSHRWWSADQVEMELLCKDGSRLPVLVSRRRVSEQESAGGTLAVFTDITDLRAAHRALQASEERYRMIIEGIADGYFEADLHGCITFFNHSLVQISGYPPDELLGLGYRSFTHQPMGRRLFKVFRSVYRSREAARIDDLEIIRKGGARRFVDVSVSLICDADGEPAGFRGIVRDVTERKLADEALQTTFAALQEMDHMKNELIQNISHEFRTPLTYVLSYADLLLDPDHDMGPLTADQMQVLGIIRDQALRLNKLIENFITAQRTGRSVLEPARGDLVILLERAVEDAQLVAARNGVTLLLRVDRNLPPALFDAAAIRQVVDNLLSNALKFTPEGGEVRVRARHDRQRVTVTVADSGTGIPPEALPRIFDRFYQADGTSRRRFGGLGLGLAICKELVEAHGERIWVESKPGQGAVFSFTLPVDGADSASPSLPVPDDGES